MIDICSCMAHQQDDGSFMCRKCHGDVYACDCALTHSINCEERNAETVEEISELDGLSGSSEGF